MECFENVRLKEGGFVRGDRVTQVGDILAVDHNTAAHWVASGRASYIVRVRALRDGILIGLHCLNLGDEAEVSEALAVMRANCGDVEVLDRGQLLVPEKLSPGSVSRPAPAAAPADPYSGQPRLRLRVLKPFMALEGCHAPENDREVIAVVPESRAVQVIAGGCAELVDPSKLTDRGRVYLSRLKTGHQGQPAAY